MPKPFTSGSTPADDIAREFDAKAGHYESNRLSGWYRAHADDVLQRVALTSSSRILDIGCGTGYFLRRAISETDGARGIGVDLSVNMIAQARALSTHLSSARIDFERADWSSLRPGLSLRLKEFAPTHAVLLSSLHYFAKPVSVFASLQDILVPGGCIWLVERERRRSLLTKTWDLAHQHVIKDHVAFFDGRQLTEDLVRAGFESINVHSRLQRWFWHGKIFTSTVLLSARTPTAEPNGMVREDQACATTP